MTARPWDDVHKHLNAYEEMSLTNPAGDVLMRALADPKTAAQKILDAQVKPTIVGQVGIGRNAIRIVSNPGIPADWFFVTDDAMAAASDLGRKEWHDLLKQKMDAVNRSFEAEIQATLDIPKEEATMGEERKLDPEPAGLGELDRNRERLAQEVKALTEERNAVRDELAEARRQKEALFAQYGEWEAELRTKTNEASQALSKVNGRLKAWKKIESLGQHTAEELAALLTAHGNIQKAQAEVKRIRQERDELTKSRTELKGVNLVNAAEEGRFCLDGVWWYQAGSEALRRHVMSQFNFISKDEHNCEIGRHIHLERILRHERDQARRERGRMGNRLGEVKLELEELKLKYHRVGGRMAVDTLTVSTADGSGPAVRFSRGDAALVRPGDELDVLVSGEGCQLRIARKEGDPGELAENCAESELWQKALAGTLETMNRAIYEPNPLFQYGQEAGRALDPDGGELVPVRLHRGAPRFTRWDVAWAVAILLTIAAALYGAARF